MTDKRIAIARAYGHDCEEWQLHWDGPRTQHCQVCGQRWRTGHGRHTRMTHDQSGRLFTKIKAVPRVAVSASFSAEYVGRHRVPGWTVNKETIQ